MSDLLIKGLTDVQVKQSRIQHGANLNAEKHSNAMLQTIKDVLTEPMFVILTVSCLVYFSVGQLKEGVIMLVALFLVAGISFFQEHRSRNAIAALRKISAAKSNVWRGGWLIKISVEEIVVGDIVKVEEGELVPADGRLLSCNDLSVNESILTGESLPVLKEIHQEVYKGTLLIAGSGEFQVESVGVKTMFGQIGKSLEEIVVTKTPLQLQMGRFVKQMVAVGFIAFLFIVLLRYHQGHDWLMALLSGLTLAMSILPEEIPVAFSTFQALGAFRLLKNNKLIVKQSQFVETLGSATVICVDKTGTITQNKMTLEFLMDSKQEILYDVRKDEVLPQELLEYAMWSSEVNPFDPMEKSIHELYGRFSKLDQRPFYHQVHEYPLSGKPPMMTHIFSNQQKEFVIAAKGAPEAILNCSKLDEESKKQVVKTSAEYAAMGYRVLAVGKGHWQEAHWPLGQQEIVYDYLGLLIFQDPPKDGIDVTMKKFHQAGISIKMITGDHPETALAIAQQIGLSRDKSFLTGNEVMGLSKDALMEKAMKTDVFARMFPEAKFRVIEALKENGEVVAMTGDGVNDAPALKAAHIGIAMGYRGSEVAKGAAALILTDDELSHMVDAVALGRKIYSNLKKAVQYIISIHVPIILIVTLPLLFNWKFNDLFTPVHVIFLELIMGPTCSVIYENEPMEPGLMNRPPIRKSIGFLSFHQLFISIVQGLFVSVGTLLLGYCFMMHGYDMKFVRTIVFVTLLLSNILLTWIGRSEQLPFWKTFRYKNYMMPLVIVASLLLIISSLYLPFVRNLFELSYVNGSVLLICLAMAIVSTIWVEIYKYFRYRNNNIIK